MTDDSFRGLQQPAFTDYLFYAKFRMCRYERDKTCPQGDYRDQEL